MYAQQSIRVVSYVAVFNERSNAAHASESSENLRRTNPNVKEERKDAEEGAKAAIASLYYDAGLPGRLRPSFLIRDSSVVGLSASRAAAPCGPRIRQPVS